MSESKKGSAYITSTFNNTMIMLSDNGDNNISILEDFRSKCGRNAGKEKIKKVTEIIASTAVEYGIDSVDVFSKGCGDGRIIALKTLLDAGLEINMIKDTTPIPYNVYGKAKIKQLRNKEYKN